LAETGSPKAQEISHFSSVQHGPNPREFGYNREFYPPSGERVIGVCFAKSSWPIDEFCFCVW
jgi:hypothetical protein